jgi:predicted nucleic acid-binding Zn ribbon protein
MRKVTRQQRQRHRVIEDWRGVAGEPLLDLPAQKLSTVMHDVLHAWKLDERLRAEEVTQTWKEIVGDFLAQHTAPDGIKRGLMTVRVLQPSIHHTLMMEKSRLLRRLQERFGVNEVREIKFRHG